MKLFVAGIPSDMDDQELNDIFAEHGTVTSAKVIMDRETGKSRGFGFVEFSEEADGQKAMQALNGATLEGKTMTVKVAEDRPRGGGGGGGFGNRGRNDGGRGGFGGNRDRR
jgi:cold-inducible RNA-binding protein